MSPGCSLARILKAEVFIPPEAPFVVAAADHGQSSGVPKNRSQISRPLGQDVLFQNILGALATVLQLSDPLPQQ
jgi:hypothetical protein